MPALARWKGHIYKVEWLGKPKEGEFKGIKRAWLVPLGRGLTAQWVYGSEIELIDNPPRAGKAKAGKDE
jgi:hypothetical protein